MRTALLLALSGCLSTPSRPLAGDARGSADAQVDGAAFSTRHWVHPAYTPGPAVAAPSLAFDSDRHEVLLYGGEAVAGATNDASMHRLTATGWELICDPCMPGPRANASFAYDPVRHVAVLVGGWTQGSTFADRSFWEWNGSTWTKSATQLPAARGAAQLVFDASRGKLVLIGGDDGSQGKNDAYTFDGSLTPLPSLSGSAEANNGGNTATYDPINMRILLLTGAGFATATGGDEVVSLGSFASSWSSVCSSCGAWRRMPVILFDPVLRRLIDVGGYNMSDALVDGTFVLGTTMFTKVDPNPPGRAYPAIVYDASRDTIVMYGGYGGDTSCPGNGDCDDTWEMVPN